MRKTSRGVYGGPTAMLFALLLMGAAGCNQNAPAPAGGGSAAPPSASAAPANSATQPRVPDDLPPDEATAANAENKQPSADKSAASAVKIGGTEKADGEEKSPSEEMPLDESDAGDDGEKLTADKPESDGAEAEKPAVEPTEAADNKPATETPLVKFTKLMRRRKWVEAQATLKEAAAAPPAEAEELQSLLVGSYAVAQQLLRAEKKTEAYASFELGAQFADKLRELGPVEDERVKMFLAHTYFNNACALSIKKEIEPALGSLKRAVEFGFSDVGALAEDEDLKALREHGDYKALAGQAVDKALAETKSFDFKFDLKDLEGKPLSLSEMKGKVVIVDFWGTWCPPCRAEIPHFVELDKEYREKGLEIVGLTYEQGEPEEAVDGVKEFAKEEKISYRLAMGDDATKEQVPELEGFPTTLFIDRKGKVRLKLTGLQSLGTLKVFTEKLLAEAAE